MSEVLIVTGPPGAGKSTTCEELARTSEGVWAFVEQDEVREFVTLGFKNPSDEWSDETNTQWNVSIDICGDMARRYQQRGINCVVDCFLALGSFDKWDEALLGVDYQMIVLLPDVEIAVERNNRRAGDARLEESKVRERHDWITAWVGDERVEIIDTSKLSIQGVVQAIRNCSSPTR